MSTGQLPRAMRCGRLRRQLTVPSGTSSLATSARRAPQAPRASPPEPEDAQSGPRFRKIQTWQALLLGSLATVAIQGVLLSAGGAGSGSAETGRVTKTSSRSSADKTAAAIPRLEEALERIASAGIEVSTAEDVLTGFATAPGTSYAPSLPLAVTYPTSTEDVVQIVNACRASKVRAFEAILLTGFAQTRQADYRVGNSDDSDIWADLARGPYNSAARARVGTHHLA